MIRSLPIYLLTLFLLSFSHPSLSQDDDQKVPIMEILYSIIQKDGVKKGIDKYYELRRTDRELYDFSFGQLNRLGLRLLAEGKTRESIEIFRLNLKIYPDMVSSHNFLADALLRDGKKDIAVNYYKKGLEKLKAIPEIDPAIYKSYEEYGLRQIGLIEELNISDNPDLTYRANFGGQPAGNWDADMILSFKKKNSIQVNYQTNNFYNTPVPENVESEFDTLKGPDVVTGFTNGYYRDFIQEGKLVDLSSFWEENNLDQSIPSYLKSAVSSDEKIYFIPIAYQWNTIWYRKDLFDSLNLSKPNTWDEFLDVCKQLKSANIQPITVSGGEWQPPLARWFSILTLRLQGYEFYESLMKGSVSWKDPKVVEVFEHWKQLFDVGALDSASANNNWSDAVAELAEGKAAMWNIGEWLFEFRPIQEQEENMDFFSVPVIREEIPRAEILHLYSAHAIENSPNVESLLKHIADPDLQKSNYDKLRYRIPARIEAQSDLSPIQKRVVEELSSVEYFVPLFEFNSHPEMAKLGLDEFLYFWKNPSDLATVIESLEEKRLQLLKSKLN